ncbi:hypothetical protein J2Z35_002116 [Acetoanaerobium pronyense]|uniref:VCBS repeat-containing protein n=1 Tax=Acetoanaerobium pronyense TaxID=1482736 RepID=A0ABS4KKK1_9FIRM|nr:VCBS repeat-containing protein [Acetoanaerobium pronyense]MBP2028315.1 hypothetical protein [Acetoanaerobium pronyense]
MKNFLKTVLLVTFLGTVLSGCTRVATPEELLHPPELNLEKKGMKDAMEKFLPANATFTVLPALDEIEKEDAFTKRDLDGSGTEELIAFYRDKSTKLIGIMVLREKNGVWSSIADIKLKSFEILQYSIKDLDGDGKREIIIGTQGDEQFSYGKKLTILGFNGDSIEPIVEMPYLAGDVYDINGDGFYEVVVTYQDTTTLENRLRVMNYKDEKMNRMAETGLYPGTEPYSIKISGIYDDKKAIFVDSFIGGQEGKTEVFFYTDKSLKDSVEVLGLSLPKKVFPVQSKDMDSNGIMEIGFPFLPPDGKNMYEPSKPWVKSYYNITNEGTLKLSKQIYEDYRMGFLFEIPESFTSRYTLEKDDEERVLRVNFIDSQNNPHLLSEIRIMNKSEWEQTEQVLQVISESSEEITGGRVEDFSEDLNEEDKALYLRMRSDILNLSNVTKPIGL